MGKNSGKRRAAKQKKEALKHKARQKEQARFSGKDEAILLELRQWLARHHPADVLMALLASDLWLQEQATLQWQEAGTIGARRDRSALTQVLVVLIVSTFNLVTCRFPRWLDLARVRSIPILL